MRDLSVVILNYRTPDLLMECLAALEQNPLTIGASEVCVVDNASGDDSVQRVRDNYPTVRVIESESNSGFAAGNNLGISQCDGRYLLVLNPDTQVHAGALDELVRFMDATPGAGAAGGQLIGLDGEVQDSCREFPNLLAVILRGTPLHRVFPNHPSLRRYLLADRPHDTLQEVDWVLGACLLMRREAWEEVGPLDEGFFMYYEDIDWCYRARRAGWAIYYAPAARITHHHRRQSAKGLFNRLTKEHIKSIMRLFRKHNLAWR
jgi:GT2 family glycosyltransferase